MDQNQSMSCTLSAFNLCEFYELCALSFDELFLATYSIFDQSIHYHQISLKTHPLNDYEFVKSIQECFKTHTDPNQLPSSITNFKPNESLKNCCSITNLIKSTNEALVISRIEATNQGYIIGALFADEQNENATNLKHLYSRTMGILDFLQDFCERYDSACKSKQKSIQNINPNQTQHPRVQA